MAFERNFALVVGANKFARILTLRKGSLLLYMHVQTLFEVEKGLQVWFVLEFEGKEAPENRLED